MLFNAFKLRLCDLGPRTIEFKTHVNQFNMGFFMPEILGVFDK